MVREIKVRVWDKVKKAWLRGDDIGIDNLGNVYLFTEDTGRLDTLNNPVWECVLLRDSDKYEVLRYTGRKDQVGVDIYEGSIVSFLDEGDEGYIEIVAQVVWGEDGAWRLEGSFNFGDWLHMYESDELLVIGNIYENRELLKEND